jgi:hypothetical protein
VERRSCVSSQGQKKSWKRPQLTVLVRIDLAESVLQTCKWNTPTGANQANNRCRVFDWQGFRCNACSGEAAS